jgi:hypothetical protein
MRVKLLTLVLAGALFLSPLAMAGELGSTDSDFLFSSDQVAATTISDQEMVETQGSGLVDVNIGDVRILNNAKILNCAGFGSCVKNVKNNSNDILQFTDTLKNIDLDIL